MYLELFQAWLGTYGYAALFGCLVFGIVGLPIPDETLLALSGYLVFKGKFSFLPTVLTAFSGSIAGISLSYTVGRLGGYRFLRRYGHRFRITEERIQKVELWYERVGKWMLAIGYFIPGVRHLMALVAGSSKMRYPVFAGFAYSGGIIWSLTFVTLGYYLGESWEQVRNHRVLLALIAASIIALILVFWYVKARLNRPHNS
jgi:membrane protein DedA with SNARE-associated domain